MDLRHQVLVMSINRHQKEQSAMETINFLIKFSTAYILIATLMEALFFSSTMVSSIHLARSWTLPQVN